MSAESRPTKLGDFVESGQTSLEYTDHLPTLDIPDGVNGYRRTQAAGRGGVVAWAGDGEIVEVQRIGGPDGPTYEVQVTEGAATRLLAEGVGEESAAVEAAADYIRGDG
jgi:hypothetical protein